MSSFGLGRDRQALLIRHEIPCVRPGFAIDLDPPETRIDKLCDSGVRHRITRTSPFVERDARPQDDTGVNGTQ